MRLSLGLLFAAGLAAGSSLAGAAMSARAEEMPKPPAALSSDFLAYAANKAECISPEAVGRMMMVDQAMLGGKTVMLIDGIDQDFATQWRVLTHAQPAEVRIVLAHGFSNPADPGRVVIDTVEFDAGGCAISRTLLSGESWDLILRAIATAGPGGSRNDSI